jgi:hypothetical protein
MGKVRRILLAVDAVSFLGGHRRRRRDAGEGGVRSIALPARFVGGKADGNVSLVGRVNRERQADTHTTMDDTAVEVTNHGKRMSFVEEINGLTSKWWLGWGKRVWVNTMMIWRGGKLTWVSNNDTSSRMGLIFSNVQLFTATMSRVFFAVCMSIKFSCASSTSFVLRSQQVLFESHPPPRLHCPSSWHSKEWAKNGVESNISQGGDKSGFL